MLCQKRGEDMIRVVFDCIIVDTGSLGASFRTRFNIDVCHSSCLQSPIEIHRLLRHSY